MFNDGGATVRGRFTEYLFADFFAEQPVNILDPFSRGRESGLGSSSPARQIVLLTATWSDARTVQLVEC